MRRTLPALLCIALAAALGMLLLRDSGSRDASSGRTAAVAPGPGGSAASPPRGPADAAAPSPDPGSRGPDWTEVPLEVEEPPRGGVAIRIFAGPEEVPVPGVVVSFFETEAAAGAYPAGSGWSERWLGPAFAARGRLFRAGPDGVVLVPRPATSATVSGGRGELHGVLRFSRGQESPVLRLRPDPPLRVRVVGARGEPAGGVAVALRRRAGGPGADLARATTDPLTGIAELEHPRSLLREAAESRATVGLAIPLREPVERNLEGGDLPGEPLELRLPPTGSVEVLLVDAAGRPLRVPAAVWMDEVPEAEGVLAAKRRGAQAITSRGRALFPHVGLGLPLRIHVHPSGTFRPVVRRYVGPTVAEELVTVAMVLEDQAVTLRGRVLDAEGRPLARAPLDVALVVPGSRSAMRGDLRERGRLETAADGTFELVLSEAWPRTGPALIELVTPGNEADVQHARAELPDPLRDGVNDLGDLRLAAPPVLARGRVVDDRGRFVPRVEIRVEGAPGTQDDERWRVLPGLRTWSDESGAFVVRGRFDGSRLALLPDHPEYTPGARVLCNVGDQDVRLELLSSGSIVGQVELDPGLSHELLGVSALRGGEHSDMYAGAFAADGSYEVRGLPEGEYRVLLALDQEEYAAATFDTVFVRPGAVTEMPPLDLRGRLTTLSIEVVDAEGNPTARGIVRTRSPGSTAFDWRVRHLIGGRLEMATPHPYLDLEIDVPGHRTTLVEQISGDDYRVALQPAPTIRLVLEHGRPYLDPGERLAVSVEKRGTGRLWHSGLATFDGRGIAETSVGDVGTHDVRVYLWRADESGGSSLVSKTLEATIDVLDQGGLQVFGMQLSPTILARIDER